jgi:hypothetical protein
MSLTEEQRKLVEEIRDEMPEYRSFMQGLTGRLQQIIDGKKGVGNVAKSQTLNKPDGSVTNITIPVPNVGAGSKLQASGPSHASISGHIALGGNISEANEDEDDVESKEEVNKPNANKQKFLEEQFETQQEQLQSNNPIHALLLKFKQYSRTAAHSSVATKHEEMYIASLSHFFIHPQSHLRLQWNFFMFLFSNTMLAILLPVVTAFLLDYNSFMKGFFVFMTCVCLLDMLINCFSALLSDTGVEVDPQVIRKNYYGGIFWSDMTCLVPFIFAIYEQFTGSMTPRLYFVLNIIGVIKYITLILSKRHATSYDTSPFLRKHIGEVNSYFVRFCVIFWRLLVFCHWIGCVQVTISIWQGRPEDSWLVELETHYYKAATPIDVYVQVMFTMISEVLGCGSVCNLYLLPAHPYTLVIRYGNQRVVSNLETWICIVSMLFGAIFYAFLVASISALLTTRDTSGQLFKQKMEQINEYMQYIELDRHTRNQVNLYFNFKYSGGKYFDQEAITKELNYPLRQV